MPKGEGVPHTPAEARQGTSREQQQPSFEERYSRFRAGEFTQQHEDGTETTYVEYRIGFNRGSANLIQAVAEFCRSASEAGYTKGLTPDIFPDIGRHPDTPDVPFDAFFFYFEKPRIEQSATIQPTQEPVHHNPVLADVPKRSEMIARRKAQEAQREAERQASSSLPDALAIQQARETIRQPVQLTEDPLRDFAAWRKRKKALHVLREAGIDPLLEQEDNPNTPFTNAVRRRRRRALQRQAENPSTEEENNSSTA